MVRKPLETEKQSIRFTITVMLESFRLFESTAETKTISEDYTELIKLALWFEAAKRNG